MKLHFAAVPTAAALLQVVAGEVVPPKIMLFDRNDESLEKRLHNECWSIPQGFSTAHFSVSSTEQNMWYRFRLWSGTACTGDTLEWSGEGQGHWSMDARLRRSIYPRSVSTCSRSLVANCSPVRAVAYGVFVSIFKFAFDGFRSAFEGESYRALRLYMFTAILSLVIRRYELSSCRFCFGDNVSNEIFPHSRLHKRSTPESADELLVDGLRAEASVNSSSFNSTGPSVELPAAREEVCSGEVRDLLWAVRRAAERPLDAKAFGKLLFGSQFVEDVDAAGDTTPLTNPMFEAARKEWSATWEELDKNEDGFVDMVELDFVLPLHMLQAFPEDLCARP